MEAKFREFTSGFRDDIETFTFSSVEPRSGLKAGAALEVIGVDARANVVEIAHVKAAAQATIKQQWNERVEQVCRPCLTEPTGQCCRDVYHYDPRPFTRAEEQRIVAGVEALAFNGVSQRIPAAPARMFLRASWR